MKCEPWLKKSWYTVHPGVRGLFNVDFSRETHWSARSHALALKKLVHRTPKRSYPTWTFQQKTHWRARSHALALKKVGTPYTWGLELKKVGTPGIARCTNFKLISRCTNELWYTMVYGVPYNYPCRPRR